MESTVVETRGFMSILVLRLLWAYVHGERDYDLDRKTYMLPSLDAMVTSLYQDLVPRFVSPCVKVNLEKGRKPDSECRTMDQSIASYFHAWIDPDLIVESPFTEEAEQFLSFIKEPLEEMLKRHFAKKWQDQDMINMLGEWPDDQK